MTIDPGEVKHELLVAVEKVRDATAMYDDAFVVSVCFMSIGRVIFNAARHPSYQAALMKIARDSYAALEKTAGEHIGP